VTHIYDAQFISDCTSPQKLVTVNPLVEGRGSGEVGVERDTRKKLVLILILKKPA
jgi:hypothetical protein